MLQRTTPEEGLSNSNALSSILTRKLSSSPGRAAHHPSPRLYFRYRGGGWGWAVNPLGLPSPHQETDRIRTGLAARGAGGRVFGTCWVLGLWEHLGQRGPMGVGP